MNPALGILLQCLACRYVYTTFLRAQSGESKWSLEFRYPQILAISNLGVQFRINKINQMSVSFRR